ncbi:Dps family protein [Granulosicoccus antarcticus]|uniref:Antigen TpF1 n=1 Tax=Granulosicoccus antarcticus IMCC3135 TaxID=1192854 RepID=A0A2Z2NZR8_9GAMM|nr:DNA starvation/stationary phase protection protein [Granulosicoccus antarcticus]ASJ75278.1 Antigen TpF1 [Granulosicoccus antarcticus IMCC3135]
MNRTNQKTIENLRQVLGQTFSLYFQSQSYHWNVEGARFRQLHEMFEEQYTELSEALDEIAERIRALGAYAPASVAQMMSYAGEEASPAQSADDMVSNIIASHQTIADTLRQAISQAAEEADEVSAGLLTDRLQVHEKTLWMLKAGQK